MRKTVTQDVEVDVEVSIDIDDVVEYIEDYACHGDLETIRNIVIEEEEKNLVQVSLIDTMKNRLFRRAAEKYSLEELEQKLGMTYLD